MPRMISLLQAVQETGLSYDCLRKLCLSNSIVHIRVGKKFLINADKLAEFLNGDSDVN